MANIFNTIKGLITSARIATGAETLGESQHKVAEGVNIILPALLAEMLKRHDSKEIEEVLHEAEHQKLYDDYDRIWRGSGIENHINVGERMENRLLSPHDVSFNEAVGKKVGIATEHADRLTNWISATIAGWVAGQIKEGKSYKTILGELSKEKGFLKEHISAEIIKLLGLEHALGIAAPAHKAVHHRDETVIEVVPGRVGKDGKKRCGLCWLWWLLGILLLALILFLCFRSCCRKGDIKTHETVTEIRTVHRAPAFEAVPMTLPDGTKITMYTGNLEEAIKAFLDSDKFKNATDAELRTVWFEFSDIDFEHNSSTELMDGSQDRLVGLVKLLKNYPNERIRIGAFADKTGTRAVNYAISLKRAETVKATLEAVGFPSTHISIEGFGEQFATVPEAASDAQRAPDRDIAMRFTK